MGRTKGTHIRMLAHRLLKMMPEEVTNDFKQDQVLVKKLGFFNQSKLEQNKLAGLLAVEKGKEMRIAAEEAADKANAS